MSDEIFHFPMLKQLTYVNLYELRFFDSILHKIYEKEYHARFNHLVYQYFDVDVREPIWITFLDKLTELQLLTKNFEICCSTCDRSILICHSEEEIDALRNTEYHCTQCDENFIITSDSLFITYSFTDNMFK
jgi:hypothetical protein